MAHREARMNEKEKKNRIKNAIASFSDANLSDAGKGLLNALGYSASIQPSLPATTPNYFVDLYVSEPEQFKKRASVDEWTYVDFLYQLTRDDLKAQGHLFTETRVDNTIMESYLFIVIGLKRPNYPRGTLAKITREVNKRFPMPVMVLFSHGETLSLAIIDRRLNKTDEMKDVLEKKVTLIKDIRIQSPHRAHIEILFDLSLEELAEMQKVRSFPELHRAWRSTLDISALNKKFYQELSNWYFWALDKVRFPDDAEKDEEIRNSVSLIRLITRVIFCWFIREKNLIPDQFFDTKELSRLLKGFMRDQSSNVYYPAILQNLFFGTLNQTMEKRGFATEGDFLSNKNHYGVKNLYRHAELFNMPHHEAVALFKDVPFLNGGLFDCLDKEDNSGKVVYIDGFSRNIKKQAVVPDYLFFESEEEVDLNEVYGTRGAKYKVKGLINILAGYKFTVAENTPVEEEVALDPELLGKVFENLLASYNPETKTTARNKTGSFYTPRPIVDYMVDESLKSYLKRHLITNTSMKEEDAATGLDILFMYTEHEHAFTQPERDTLINAIDELKVFDPACGSGAFPMGILNKLVYILHKLDEHNELWKQRQIRNAESIEDSEIREHTIADIESAFAHNELDYGRKLYLIEHCIYGADIQPIAVQIAKLRCFISLIIDQNKKPGTDNLGIRSLPNLETKFVAADSLIGISHQGIGELRNPEIDATESCLKELRHNYFSAKNRTNKLLAQEKDRELRKRIEALLIEDGMDHRDANLVAAFDPYDQNAHAPFFDAEWMFGLVDGFDIVIGNPPYVQIQSYSGKPEQQRWESQQYKVWGKTADLCCLFYERGYGLLAERGMLCYITSNKWMRANYGRAMRQYFLSNGSIRKIIDFGDSPIFESATTYTNITLWSKETGQKPKVWDLSKAYEASSSLTELLDRQGEGEALFTPESFVITWGDEARIKKRIEEVGTPLRDWDISIYRGILTGLNEAFIIDKKKYDELVAADPRSAEVLKPILRGRDIKRYKAEWAGLYLIASHNGYKLSNGRKIPRIDLEKDYPVVFAHLKAVGDGIERGTIKVKGKGLYDRDDQGDHWSNLRDCAYFNVFGRDKLFWLEMATEPTYSYEPLERIILNTAFILVGEKIKFLLAILNSSTMDFYLPLISTEVRGNTRRYFKQYVELSPIPKISKEQGAPYEILVDCIQFGYVHGLEFEAKTLESLIDVMVYGLYFEAEMRESGCYINERVAEIVKPFAKGDSDDFKTEYIRQFAAFCDKDPTLHAGLIHSRNVKSVEIILGALKR